MTAEMLSLYAFILPTNTIPDPKTCEPNILINKVLKSIEVEIIFRYN